MGAPMPQIKPLSGGQGPQSEGEGGDGGDGCPFLCLPLLFSKFFPSS